MAQIIRKTKNVFVFGRNNFNKAFSAARYKSTKPSYFHHIGKDVLKPLTVGLLLEQSASKYNDREALISRHQNKRLTFQQILKQSDTLAAGLSKIGLQKGDRLGLWAPNIFEWHITKMACARLGLVMVALNPAYQPPEMEYCVNKVGIKAVVCAHKHKTQNYYEMLVKIAPELPKSEPGKLFSEKVPSLKSVVVITEEDLKGAYKFGEVLDLADETAVSNVKRNQHLIKLDEGCNIQFTSGTTGNPKAALLSHFNLVNNSFLIGKRNELSSKHHKICLQVPFFHVFGLDIGLLSALTHGATLVLPAESYNPERSLDAIAAEQCTSIYGTPTMFVDLINSQIKRKENINPEIAVCGGAPTSPHLFKQMLEILKVKKVKSVYGLTETTAVCFQSLPGDDEAKSTGTVGHLHDHLEAKVIDENGFIVPMGTPGELCVRGYCNVLGYWGDEAKTKELIGDDKWLRTGDQFVLTEDGYGKVVGRLKEMIIRGGENIFPKEIEDFLNTHPDVLETYVIGLPHERLGEEVCACIRVKEGANVTHETIKEYCKGQIAHFKIPSHVKVVEEFPKTTSGKIQKFKLVEQFKN